MKSPFDVAKKYLETPIQRSVERSPAVETSDVSEGQVKAVRGQHTQWHDLTVDENTTGVLICSTVLDADVWLALREDFDPDPDLPSFAVFYIDEIPILKNKTLAQLREIHAWKLAFGPGSRVSSDNSPNRDHL